MVRRVVFIDKFDCQSILSMRMMCGSVSQSSKCTVVQAVLLPWLTTTPNRNETHLNACPLLKSCKLRQGHLKGFLTWSMERGALIEVESALAKVWTEMCRNYMFKMLSFIVLVLWQIRVVWIMSFSWKPLRMGGNLHMEHEKERFRWRKCSVYHHKMQRKSYGRW